MEGKLEQLCAKLLIEQERNAMMTESHNTERKHLARTVKQLQSEYLQKDEDYRRLKVVADQLRILVATGSLNI